MPDPGDQYTHIIREVAEHLLGTPNKSLSTKDVIRFGTRGSISVNLKAGTFYDHEQKSGGGCLALVEAQTGKKGHEAADWLREQGFDLPKPEADHRPAAGKMNGKAAEPKAKPKLTQTWDYVDGGGELVFQVCRLEDGSIDPKTGKPNKTFRQRRPDGRGGWEWSVKGIEQVPYRLPDVVEAIASGFRVFVVEGEKAADALWSIGVPATTAAMGAGKWPEELNQHFVGADVTILPDNDEPGEKHRDLVGTSLRAVASSVSVLDLPGLPPKGDAVEWIKAGGTADQLYDLVDAVARPFTERSTFRSKFNAVSWRDLDTPGPQHEWLAKGLMTRGELSMMAGSSQSGKTFLALDMSMAVALGGKWFGMQMRKGGVIYQAGESARGVRRKRIPAYRIANSLSADADVPFVLLQAPLDLFGSDDPTAAFIEEAKHWGSTFPVPLELIVIDTYSAATPGADENSAKDMTVVLARCQRISAETGAAVMLVHHMNASGEKPRGHTSVFANLDSVITVKKLDRKDRDGKLMREFKIAKAKDGEDARAYRFVLSVIEIGKDEEGDPMTSCVVSMPRGAIEPITMDELAELTKRADKDKGHVERYLKCLSEALHKVGGDRPPDVKLDPDVTRVCLHTDVSALYKAGDPIQPGDDPTAYTERLKKQVDRARSALKEIGAIDWTKTHVGLRRPPPQELLFDPNEKLPPEEEARDPFGEDLLL